MRPERRAKFKLPWILANVGYDVVYTLVMIKVFGKYGVNGWVYVVYIAVFSLLYAWSTFEVVGALADGLKRRAHIVGTIAVLAFLAPDAYLVFATRNVPWYVWVILGTYVTITATAAAIAIRKKVRAKRAEAQASRTASSGMESRSGHSVAERGPRQAGQTVERRLPEARQLFDQFVGGGVGEHDLATLRKGQQTHGQDVVMLLGKTVGFDPPGEIESVTALVEADSVHAEPQ